jgi:hypothetical protein
LPPYEDDKAAWEKAREYAIKSCKGDRAKIRDSLDAVGPPPVPPLAPMLTCSEPTFEGLYKLYAGRHPSLGIFATEGGQFIGGHAMNDDNKLRTAAGLWSLWDGEPIGRVRGGDGAVVLPGRRLTAHLMAQPAVADMLFRDRFLADQGLLSRLIISAPDSASGTRFWRDEDPGTDYALKSYDARVLEMLEASLPLAVGKINELQPRRLPLSSAARQLWIDFADHVERAIGTGGELEPIRGLANKLPEHAARLAGVLTLVRNLRAVDIGTEEIGAGIALAEHYAAEALRLFGTSGVSGDLRLAQRLLYWLLNSWGAPVISLVEIYQRGPNSIRDAATTKRLMGILEDHGWLAKIPQGAVAAGQRRRDAWRAIRG